MSDYEEEVMDYSKVVVFSESETEDQSKTKVMEVWERTGKVLQGNGLRECLMVRGQN